MKLFILKSPEKSIIQAIKHNILYFLMLHFDHVKVQEFFWDLLHPMQGQMILCEKDLYLIWAYFKDTNFMSFWI